MNDLHRVSKLKKISKSKIAATYALALYEAAAEKKAVAKVYDDVRKLQAEISEDADFIKYFANPVWNRDSKKETLNAVAAKMKLSSESRNCLDIIADNERLPELKEILQEFIHLYHQKNNIAEVEVQSAQALSVAQVKKLEASLEKLLKQKVLVSYLVKPEVLGGLKVKYGSNMIDDTLLGKLNRLEQVMKGGQ